MKSAKSATFALLAMLVSAVVQAEPPQLRDRQTGKYLGNLISIPMTVVEIINFIVSFAVITVLFAMIFKFLPDVTIAWRDVWIGASITSFLFTLGKFLLGFYLGRSSISSSYGAAGSLVLILVWVYYSSQILFFGAEFTQVYANRYGSKIVPNSQTMAKTTETKS